MKDARNEGPFRSEDVPKIVSLLKACANQRDLHKGSTLHAYILKRKLLKANSYVASALVNMYARCGALAEAEQVLEQFPVPNVVMWTALVAGYAHQGQGEEALKCFDRMQRDGHSPDAVTFISVLKACGSIGAAAKGKQIHDIIISLGMLEKHIVLGSTLLDMYVRCGELNKAQQVLEELPVRNVVTWTELVAGYALQGQGEEALKCLDNMEHEGHSPDAVTFTFALKACGNIGALAKGKEIHDKLVSLAMLEKDVMLGSTLVDMYARCGALAKAQQALKELPLRNVVTWNALIAGYAQQGQGKEALKCFDIMQENGHSPDLVSFICALKACGSIGAVFKGKQIHDVIVELGLLEKDLVLGSSLVGMYAMCGELAKAQQVLKEIPVRNAVTWNAVITGYVQQEQGEEALKCYDCMQREGVTLNAVTFSCALKACGSIGAAAKGKCIHDEIISLSMLEKDFEPGNSLVDMYARCGALAKARQVLEELPVRNVVTWTVLIVGYGHQGQGEEALYCFEQMQSEGVKPDSTTLICILNACGHSGLLDPAEMFFSRMSTEYGIMPDVEHYSCMVDLFGRIGKFNEALSAIEEMPFAKYFPAWVALLSACGKWGDMKIGRYAFDSAFHSDISNHMENMYNEY